MRINKSEFIPICVSGIFLLYSYYYYATQNKTNVTNLWGRITEPYKTMYYGSMIVTALAFCVVLGYLMTTTAIENKIEKNKILISLLSIIVISIFWMPLSLEYLKRKPYKYAIISILLIVSFLALYNVFNLRNIRETDNKTGQTLAVYSMVIFFCHTFFLDALTWSYYFFTH
jgi:hypothetical protein